MTEVFTGLSGDGNAMLAAPKYIPRLGVSLTTVPGGVAITSGGTPRRLMKAGWVSPSRVGSDVGWPATLFCEDARWINWERQQISYPQPGVWADQIRYHLEPGVVANLYVNDNSSVGLPNTSLAPWDRSPTVWSIGGGFSVTGAASATMWTYTVPAGRILLVSHAELTVNRTVAASTPLRTDIYLYRSNWGVLQIEHYSNAVGFRDSRELDSGSLILLPGDWLSAVYAITDTGGTQVITATANGTLFAL